MPTLLPPRPASHSVLRRNGQQSEKRPLQILLHGSPRALPAGPTAAMRVVGQAARPQLLSPPRPALGRARSVACARSTGSWGSRDAAHRWAEVGASHPSHAPASAAGRQVRRQAEFLVTESELRQLICPAEAKLHHLSTLSAGSQSMRPGPAAWRRLPAPCGCPEPQVGSEPDSLGLRGLPAAWFWTWSFCRHKLARRLGPASGGPQGRRAGGVPAAGTSSVSKG